MSSNNSCAQSGIVHFWQLPHKLHVVLDPVFKQKLLQEFMKVARTKYCAQKITGIKRITLSEYLNEEKPKIRIDFLFQILAVTSNSHFNVDIVERNIFWIGHFNSHGVVNPKLPFNLNSRSGAHFLAAICNDGWISDGAYYSNNNHYLRSSVIQDTLKVFGGDNMTVHEWIKEKDQYLSFPSIIRDVLIILTGFKGIKSENNPTIPQFILKNHKLMLGWIEQTIADEGCVEFYPQKYRREII